MNDHARGGRGLSRRAVLATGGDNAHRPESPLCERRTGLGGAHSAGRQNSPPRHPPGSRTSFTNHPV